MDLNAIGSQDGGTEPGGNLPEIKAAEEVNPQIAFSSKETEQNPTETAETDAALAFAEPSLPISEPQGSSTPALAMDEEFVENSVQDNDEQATVESIELSATDNLDGLPRNVSYSPPDEEENVAPQAQISENKYASVDRDTTVVSQDVTLPMSEDVVPSKAATEMEEDMHSEGGNFTSDHQQCEESNIEHDTASLPESTPLFTPTVRICDDATTPETSIPIVASVSESTVTTTTETFTTPSKTIVSTTVVEETTQSQQNLISWLQCENCEKWRKVPAHVDLSRFEGLHWTCKDNTWDTSRASCDASEEEYVDPPATEGLVTTLSIEQSTSIMATHQDSFASPGLVGHRHAMGEGFSASRKGLVTPSPNMGHRVSGEDGDDEYLPKEESDRKSGSSSKKRHREKTKDSGSKSKAKGNKERASKSARTGKQDRPGLDDSGMLSQHESPASAAASVSKYGSALDTSGEGLSPIGRAFDKGLAQESLLNTEATTAAAVPAYEWVQCENASCGKWRRLPIHIPASSLPEKWVCRLATWPLSPTMASTFPDGSPVPPANFGNSCDVPEEVWDETLAEAEAQTNLNAAQSDLYGTYEMADAQMQDKGQTRMTGRKSSRMGAFLTEDEPVRFDVPFPAYTYPSVTEDGTPLRDCVDEEAIAMAHIAAFANRLATIAKAPYGLVLAFPKHPLQRTAKKRKLASSSIFPSSVSTASYYGMDASKSPTNSFLHRLNQEHTTPNFSAHLTSPHSRKQSYLALYHAMPPDPVVQLALQSSYRLPSLALWQYAAIALPNAFPAPSSATAPPANTPSTGRTPRAAGLAASALTSPTSHGAPSGTLANLVPRVAFTGTSGPVPVQSMSWSSRFVPTSADKKALVPPQYVSGVQDQVSTLLHLPIEIWCDLDGGSGIFYDQVQEAWVQAMNIGPSIFFNPPPLPKINYSEFISGYWGGRGTKSFNEKIFERGSLSKEAVLRWVKSVFFRAPKFDTSNAVRIQAALKKPYSGIHATLQDGITGTTLASDFGAETLQSQQFLDTNTIFRACDELVTSGTSNKTSSVVPSDSVAGLNVTLREKCDVAVHSDVTTGNTSVSFIQESVPVQILLDRFLALKRLLQTFDSCKRSSLFSQGISHELPTFQSPDWRKFSSTMRNGANNSHTTSFLPAFASSRAATTENGSSSMAPPSSAAPFSTLSSESYIALCGVNQNQCPTGPRKARIYSQWGNRTGREIPKRNLIAHPLDTIVELLGEDGRWNYTSDVLRTATYLSRSEPYFLENTNNRIEAIHFNSESDSPRPASQAQRGPRSSTTPVVVREGVSDDSKEPVPPKFLPLALHPPHTPPPSRSFSIPYETFSSLYDSESSLYLLLLTMFLAVGSAADSDQGASNFAQVPASFSPYSMSRFLYLLSQLPSLLGGTSGNTESSNTGDNNSTAQSKPNFYHSVWDVLVNNHSLSRPQGAISRLGGLGPRALEVRFRTLVAAGLLIPQADENMPNMASLHVEHKLSDSAEVLFLDLLQDLSRFHKCSIRMDIPSATTTPQPFSPSNSPIPSLRDHLATLPLTSFFAILHNMLKAPSLTTSAVSPAANNVVKRGDENPGSLFEKSETSLDISTPLGRNPLYSILSAPFECAQPSVQSFSMSISMPPRFRKAWKTL